MEFSDELALATSASHVDRMWHMWAEGCPPRVAHVAHTWSSLLGFWITRFRVRMREL